MKGREGRRGGGQRGDGGREREREMGTERRSGNRNELGLYYTRLDIAKNIFYGSNVCPSFWLKVYFRFETFSADLKTKIK